MTLLNEQNRQQLNSFWERNSPKIPCKPSQAPKTCRKESSSHKVAIKHTMSKSFMWVLCIGEKKTSVHSIQCHCQGRLVLSSINYCLKKCLGEKKRKKECRRLSPNMYCIYVLEYPSYFQIKKGFNYHKIICQIKTDYLCFAIFFECVFDVQQKSYIFHAHYSSLDSFRFMFTLIYIPKYLTFFLQEIQL